MTTPSFPSNLSDAALQAMRWAVAAAACRQGVPPGPNGPLVEATDLLVGMLLADPRPGGGAWALLGHFGLTARDVLPHDYPAIPARELQRYAHDVDPTAVPPVGPSAQSVLLDAERRAQSQPIGLAEILAGLLSVTSAIGPSLVAAFSAVGENVSTVSSSYEEWLSAVASAGQSSHGFSLETWLQNRLPRQPVQVPGYASDQIDPGQDLIGIAAEADAFAYLIASRDLKPPLAVGLFGNWGSGKSFLMRAVQNRIGEFGNLVQATDQRDSPVWKNIKQIEFNAWEYVDGDLWSGLLERIFRELGTVPTVKGLVDKRRDPLQEEIKTEEQAARAADSQVTGLKLQEQTAERELTEAKDEAATTRQDAEKALRERLDKQAKDNVYKALASVWGEHRTDLIGQSGADLLDAIDEATKEMQHGSSALGPYLRNGWRIAALTAGAALIPLIALVLLKVVGAPPLVSALGGLAAVVPVAASVIRAAAKWSRDRITDLAESAATIRAEVQQPVDEADRKVTAAQRELARIQAEIRQLQAAAETARERRDALAAEIAELTPERVFVQFADERSSIYRRRLGLLSVVRADLTKLQREIQDHNTALLRPDGPSPSSMPNRIVLYIDDLDRCPPHKVVEVLEAVHLLLAFELFVVVVAVDSRWLSSALTEQLHALGAGASQQAGQPTPQDYLEKIFQLPFWVQALSIDDRQNLVRGLLADSVSGVEAGDDEGRNGAGLVVGEEEAAVVEAMLQRRGSGLYMEARALLLSPEDLAFIESLVPLLGDTPRRVKRFINICQFLLAMRPPLATDGGHSDRHIACLLAAINEGLPTVADGLFAAVRCGTGGTLGPLLSGLANPREAERTALRTWLGRHAGWQDLPGDRLSTRLDIISRLRFGAPTT